MKIIEIPEFKDRGNVLQLSPGTSVQTDCQEMVLKNDGSWMVAMTKSVL